MIFYKKVTLFVQEDVFLAFYDSHVFIFSESKLIGKRLFRSRTLLIRGIDQVWKPFWCTINIIAAITKGALTMIQLALTLQRDTKHRSFSCTWCNSVIPRNKAMQDFYCLQLWYYFFGLSCGRHLCPKSI